jgi:hypothetical protein
VPVGLADVPVGQSEEGENQFARALNNVNVFQVSTKGATFALYLAYVYACVKIWSGGRLYAKMASRCGLSTLTMMGNPHAHGYERQRVCAADEGLG